MPGVIEHGRATMRSDKGYGGDPCVNCGTVHATMYEIGLAKGVGEKPHVTWRLCVDCHRHLGGVFEKFDDMWRDI
jgi:hypothetical protein